jgi:HD-GYP domain-containing protein (c-di-GMP phosphodiesterase class II)
VPKTSLAQRQIWCIKTVVNWLELLYAICALVVLLWLHSRRAIWGRVPFVLGLGFVVLAVWLLEQRFSSLWLSDGLYFVVQAMLVLDYLLEKTPTWRLTVLLTAAFGTLFAFLDSVGMNLLGVVNPFGLVGWHSVFLLGTAIAVWGLDFGLKRFGLSRIMSVFALLAFSTWLWFTLLERPYSLESQLLLVLVVFVILALYLERINPIQTMPAAQLAAYQNLLGTLEQLANPTATRQVETDLVTTLFGTARVMASGSNDNELWSRLLGTAVLLVPGAEGGSLRLRHGNQFVYVAQQGYSDELLSLRLSEQNAKNWHGDVLAWHRGEPRILRQPQAFLGELNAKDFLQNRQLRTNLYLPVVVGNEVLADLNLDNFGNENAFGEDSIQAARQFSIQVGALISAQRERRELETRLREFAAIEAITEALHDARTPAQIADAILKRTIELLEISDCAFLLITSDAQHLRIIAAYGVFSRVMTGIETDLVPRGKGLTWASLETRGTIYSSNTQNDPRAFGNIHEQTTHGLCQLTVPILDSGGAPLGVLAIARELPSEFTNFDQRLTELIAKVAGSALERIRATENLERQIFESRNLLNLARLLEGSDQKALENALERVRQLAVADAALLLRLEGGLFRVQTQVGDSSNPTSIERSLELEPLLVWARQPMQRSLELNAELVGSTMRQIGVRSMLASMLDSGGTLLGAIMVYRFDQTGWNRNEKHLIEAAGGMIGALLARLERLETLEAAYEGSLAMIGRALEMRDLETGNHTERVTQMAVRMAKALNLPDQEIRAVRWGAYLHDVGKFAISDTVLRKPGKLEPNELGLIRQHPQNGYDLIKDIPFLPLTTKHIVLYHHERWDGTGYPTRLAAEDIPLAARIFAVCDVFDALQSKRVYKEAYSPTRTLAELYASAHDGHLELRLVRLLERLVQEDSTLFSQNAPLEWSDESPSHA